MPRANRRRVDPPRVAGSTASQRREEWRGEHYAVRAISAAAAVKAYRCPGCDHEIAAGRPHVVAWPEHDADAGSRRHWHRACWTARDTRRPDPLRGRATPRY